MSQTGKKDNKGLNKTEPGESVVDGALDKMKKATEEAKDPKEGDGQLDEEDAERKKQLEADKAKKERFDARVEWLRKQGFLWGSTGYTRGTPGDEVDDLHVRDASDEEWKETTDAINQAMVVENEANERYALRSKWLEEAGFVLEGNGEVNEYKFPGINHGLAVDIVRNALDWQWDEIKDDIVKALAQHAKQNAVVDPETKKREDEHAANLAKYGADYVKAKRSGGQRTVFSRQAWNMMGGNRAGWLQEVEILPEIAAMRREKAAGDNPENA